MPRADRLLRLYPPAWRERYGDEFLAMLGTEPLRVAVVFDIVMAAIDAWLSADVHRAARARRAVSNRGGTMTMQSFLACGRAQHSVTRRDGLLGASVILAVSFLMAFGGTAARRTGWPLAGELLKDNAFFAALLVSMPFWLTKGQPWKAQALIIAVTLAILVGASLLALV
jgi:hypothetical protein